MVGGATPQDSTTHQTTVIHRTNKMKNKPQSPKLKVFRQGDILILGVDEIPKKIRKLAQADSHIVAEGEATGHHHAIPHVAGLSVYMRRPGVHRRGMREEDEEPKFWLKVEEQPARMEHPEHGTIEIPLGDYEIRRQREYDPIQSHYVQD